MVVAVAILSAGFTVEEGDIFDRSMGYRTMFACLFGTLPFLLFGTEADLEPKQSRPLDAVGRRKLKPRIAVLFVLGVLALLVSLVPGELVYPWLQKLLLSVGIATLILCVELGYRLWTSRPSGSGGNDPAISHGND